MSVAANVDEFLAAVPELLMKLVKARIEENQALAAKQRR